MTPFASVAMLEKFALLKIARCKAPAFSKPCVCRTFVSTSATSGELLWSAGICLSFHLIPTLSHAAPSTEGQLNMTRGAHAFVSGDVATAYRLGYQQGTQLGCVVLNTPNTPEAQQETRSAAEDVAFELFVTPGGVCTRMCPPCCATTP